MTIIASICDRYQFLKDRCVNVYETTHAQLSELLRQKNTIDEWMRELERDDQSIQTFRLLLSYMCFEYVNCPLFFNSTYFYRNNRLEKIDALIRRLSIGYPSKSSTFKNISEILASLYKCEDNPILEQFEKSIGYANTELVLINPDCTEAVMEMCKDYGIRLNIVGKDFESKSSEKLKGVYCGCAKYFPPAAFWAPLYSEINLIRYAGVKDYVRNSPEVHGSLLSNNNLILTTNITSSPILELPSEIEIGNPIEEVDPGLFKKYEVGQNGEASFDSQEARVVILQGGKFVFLPADYDYTHHSVINLDKQPVEKKISINEFDENTAILLREQRNGDYLTEVANEFLPEKGKEFRSLQAEWKKRLKFKISQLGALEVRQRLEEMGCNPVSPQNLRNWLSPRSIRPDDDNGFLQMLEYLELGDYSETILKAMNAIRAAHLKAGFRVSKQLRGLVENDKSLKNILSDGYRIYHLSKSEADKLGVYVFKRLLADPVKVSDIEIGAVKDLEAVYG